MTGNSGTAADIFTWWTVVKFAFTTGLFTALFTQGFAWVKGTVQGWAKTRRQGHEVSLMLVPLLTAYAQDCLSRVEDNEFGVYNRGYGSFKEMPVLQTYPVRDGLVALPRSIAGALLDLRDAVIEADRHISYTDNINGHPEAVEVANIHFVSVGHHVVCIASRLRKHYKFGPRQPVSAYYFAAELQRRYRKNHPGLVRKTWDSHAMHRLRQATQKRWHALTAHRKT